MMKIVSKPDLKLKTSCVSKTHTCLGEKERKNAGSLLRPPIRWALGTAAAPGLPASICLQDPYSLRVVWENCVDRIKRRGLAEKVCVHRMRSRGAQSNVCVDNIEFTTGNYVWDFVWKNN